MAIKIDDEEDIIADINMTPLIDIMLVLLIIFMVTSSISLESGLDINLPSTTSITRPNKGGAILVSIDKKGTIFVQGEKVNFDQLKEKIASAIEQESTQTVIFEGDETTALGKTIQIMDLAKEAGAKKFAIAANSTVNNL